MKKIWVLQSPNYYRYVTITDGVVRNNLDPLGEVIGTTKGFVYFIHRPVLKQDYCETVAEGMEIIENYYADKKNLSIA